MHVKVTAATLLLCSVLSPVFGRLLMHRGLLSAPSAAGTGVGT